MVRSIKLPDRVQTRYDGCLAQLTKVEFLD